ncbi:MAG TPA: hypothetical protein VF468_02295 [Actinomycetota bacterium]|nr:hypothetical protein [Actinomycetota bacterium]
MAWRKRRRQPEPQPGERDSEPGHPMGVPEGSGKEFARGESHVADLTHDRYDGLGKGFAHGEVSEQTEALADHGVPEGSGKQFASGEAEIVWDDDRVGDLSKGYAKGQAHLAGAEDPDGGPPLH